MIMDLKGIKWRHIRNVSPKYSKKVMGLLQVRICSVNTRRQSISVTVNDFEVGIIF